MNSVNRGLEGFSTPGSDCLPRAGIQILKETEIRGCVWVQKEIQHTELGQDPEVCRMAKQAGDPGEPIYLLSLVRPSVYLMKPTHIVRDGFLYPKFSNLNINFTQKYLVS